MATLSIRSTYALDSDTVERIARLAEKWGVSRSEALRRAVRSASQSLPGDRLAALDALQSSGPERALGRRMDPGGSARAAGQPSGQETVTARIHLDTGFLIRTLIRRTAEETALRSVLTAQTGVAISSVAWAEFLCGPLTSDAVRQARLLIGQPLPFTEADAEMAARLFNRGGRRRGTFADCMVAAVAIRDQSALATTNRKGFARFQTEGLNIL